MMNNNYEPVRLEDNRLFLLDQRKLPNHMEYLEAATIVGANAWQRCWRVTFPLSLPAFNNAFVYSLIGGLNVFDIIVATTNGGPGVTTQVMNTMIYRSFSFNMQGEANAGYVLLAVIVALFAVSSYSIIRKREVDL